MRERRHAEHTVGSEADADDDHDPDTPRLGSETAKGAIETCCIVGVVLNRGSRQEESDKSETDTAPDLADRSERRDDFAITRAGS